MNFFDYLIKKGKLVSAVTRTGLWDVQDFLHGPLVIVYRAFFCLGKQLARVKDSNRQWMPVRHLPGPNSQYSLEYCQLQKQ